MLGDFPSAAKLDSNFCDVARHRDVDWAEFHVVLISSAGIVRKTYDRRKRDFGRERQDRVVPELDRVQGAMSVVYGRSREDPIIFYSFMRVHPASRLEARVPLLGEERCASCPAVPPTGLAQKCS